MFCHAFFFFFLIINLYFLIINLYFLIPAVIAKTFNRNAELVIPIGTPSKKAKVKIKIHSVIVEAKTRKSSKKSRAVECFCAFYSSINFGLFFKEIISCFIYIF